MSRYARTELVQIPKGFLNDHEDRGLPTPIIEIRTASHYFIHPHDPAFAESPERRAVLCRRERLRMVAENGRACDRSSDDTMTRAAEFGPWKGAPVRTVRKPGKCAGFGQCGTVFGRGDSYVEGDPQYDNAGGFGHDRLCFPCAGNVPT